MPQDHILDSASTQSVDRSDRKRATAIRNAVIVIATALSLIGLYYLSTYSYLLFHNIVEVFSIVIALAIFVIAWNTRDIIDNNFFLFIGIAFVFVAGLDLCHTLAYKGMGVFPGFVESNLATQLWIAMRYMLSFTFLLPIVFINRKVKPSIIFAGYSIATFLLLASIFIWQNFPAAYDINAQTLTTFKVVSEYAVSLIILVAAGLLIRKRKEFSNNIFKLLLAAMLLAAATDMAFTLYTDIYGITNMIGHLLNVLSFYLIYRALVQTNLNQPYETLFRNLKHSETTLAKRAEELSEANTQLEKEITQRQTTEQALRQSEERLQLKLDSVLSPDTDLDEQDIANIIDVPSLQETMNHFYKVTNMGFALVDLKGNVLVGTGWQDICTKFHRVNPQTCQNCIESDIELANQLNKGEIRLYKCKNNMIDMVTPLFIGDKHVANVFFGQFFLDSEKVDRSVFVEQAEKYGFDKEEYLAALDRVPRLRKQNIEQLMLFYTRFSEVISKTSFANLKLAKLLSTQKELQLKLEDKAAEVEEYACQMEQLAEERAKQLKDAERLSAIGATAGMVGHDIRNPLQAIISELYLANLEVDSLKDEQVRVNLHESIKEIEENLFYIDKIVADLQDFARPLKPNMENMNVEKTVKDILLLVNTPQDVKVTVDVPADLVLAADAIMLKRVLVNLIQNAMQAMPKGGDLKIAAQIKGKEIVISIQDTGEGIPKEFQSKLFTPLMTTKSKGQGFGLPVVKRMTEAMGGTVTFTSQQGTGTTFTLRFPA